jgi:hypothetical protein
MPGLTAHPTSAPRSYRDHDQTEHVKHHHENVEQQDGIGDPGKQPRVHQKIITLSPTQQAVMIALRTTKVAASLAPIFRPCLRPDTAGPALRHGTSTRPDFDDGVF